MFAEGYFGILNESNERNIMHYHSAVAESMAKEDNVLRHVLSQ